MAHTQKPQLPEGFPGVFIGKIWGESCRVFDFLLAGWWSGNRVDLQESCAKPEVTILHMGWGQRSLVGPCGGKESDSIE